MKESNYSYFKLNFIIFFLYTIAIFTSAMGASCWLKPLLYTERDLHRTERMGAKTISLNLCLIKEHVYGW